MVDLHSHSTVSDGELKPGELVRLASEKKLSVLALTDHDTLAGLNEAQKHAKRLNIALIRGVETAVDFRPGEFHLLGLGIREGQEQPLESFLIDIRDRRSQRNREMTRLMNADGLPVSMAILDDIAGGGVIARPHFARWLIGTGRCRNIEEAFRKWIGLNCPYYVPKNLPSLEENTEAIHKAGGKAVMAHPLSLRISWGRFASLIPQWLDQGLDGLEAWHSGARKGDALRLEELARKNGLLVSGGSDFHGPGRKDRMLGLGAAGLTLDDGLARPFL